MKIRFDDNIIRFAQCKKGAIIPSKRLEDGAMDVYACFDGDYIELQPQESKLIPTGLKSAFSPKWRIVFQERGSTGKIGLKVNAGLIDSGYRGEWFVCLHNASKKTILIDKRFEKTEEYDGYVHYPYSKAICQAKVQEVPPVVIAEASEDEIMRYESQRGEGSLGSSNK
jgi:dUTP pyrophosphatase